MSEPKLKEWDKRVGPKGRGGYKQWNKDWTHVALSSFPYAFTELS